MIDIGRKVFLLLCALLLFPPLLPERVYGEEWSVSDLAWFVAGGMTGFVIHEGTHMLVAESLGFDTALEARSRPIPFVIVRYDLKGIKEPSGDIRYVDEGGNPVTDGAQKRFVIASAGINSQHITSEWILTRYPRLRGEARPFLKGILAFNLLTSIGYSLIGRKDDDGDLHGMSEALGVGDRLVGALVFLPAALDFYRYYFPDSVWAPWAARGAKAYFLGLSFRW